MAYSEDDRPLGTSGSDLPLCPRRHPRHDHHGAAAGRDGRARAAPGDGPAAACPPLEVTVSEGEDEQDFFVHYDTDNEDGSQWVEIHVDDDEWSFRSWRR